MPQAVALAPVVAAGLGATGATLAFITLVSVAFSFALNYKRSGSGNENQSAGHLLNGKSTQAPIPVVYGQRRVGGNHIYINATGYNNERLHVIQTLCEGEIDSVVNIFGDEKNVTAFGGNFGYELFNGAANQAVCANLQSYDPAWNDPLRKTAYLYMQLVFNAEIFLSLPLLTAEIKGLKVYDPRTSTTAWSDNPALCIYDFMRNSRYGLGLDASYIDEDSIEDFANWCDAQGYSCNAVIDGREPAIDIISKMLASCRGFLVYTDGLFYLRGLDYDSPVMDLDEDDIKAGSFSFAVPGLQELPNAIRAKFINAANKYVLEDFVLNDTVTISLDGETREQEMELTGVGDYEQAYKMALYQIERQKLNRVYSFVCGPAALPLEPGDIVRITHTLPGWTNQVCRVKEVQILETHEVALSVLEESAALYDDTINVATHGTYSTTLPDPLAIPPPPSDITFTEEAYTIKDNSFSRLKVSWTEPANYPFLDYVEIWVSKDAGTTYVHHTDAVGSAVIDNLIDGGVVYVKLRSVSTYGIKNTLANLSPYYFTITGKSTAPDNVAGFQGTAAGDTVLLRWDEIGMEDLAGYEIRYGSNWGSSLYFGFTKSQSLSIVGIKPGVHSFAIKAKDTLGNYSATAAVATVTVFDPPGYAEVASNTVDYSTQGTHNHTEYYNDPTHGASLRLVSPYLTGDYTSPSYDLGSKQKCRHWLNYILNINATGATWEGGIGNVDWDDVLSSGETWIQQFANVQAGTFRAKFFYSDDNANWTEIDHFEILSVEVDARYIKYQIFLTYNDANSSVYVEPAVLKSWWR